MSNFISVKKFMETFGQEVKSKAAFPSEKISKLRYDLIKEELDEFREALNDKNLKEVADSLTDILYVTYGKPIYNEHGKVMKGPNYFEPNLKKFID